MPEKKYSIIVASPRARTGKTLLARLVVEHFVLSGVPHVIFDTDAVDKKLAGYFPEKTVVVDFDRVPDQMKLFDTLGSPVATTQVVDLTHRSFRKFFKLMREIDYVNEAKASGFEPVVLFIPDTEADSYEQGMEIREWLRGVGFALVRNEAVGEPSREALRNLSFAAFVSNMPRLTLTRLDPFFYSAIADPKFSLSEFMRRSLMRESPSPVIAEQLSLAYMSREARSGITAWAQAAFSEIRRVLREVEIRTDLLSHDRPNA
ncbi:MAG TPA: hypothetical protein VH765_14670 [Xanthobacteraceae bacterium]